MHVFEEIIEKIKYLFIIFLMTIILCFLLWLIKNRPLTNNPTFILLINGIKKSDIILQIDKKSEKLYLFENGDKNDTKIGMAYLSGVDGDWDMIELQEQDLSDKNIFIRWMIPEFISFYQDQIQHTIVGGRIKNNLSVEINNQIVHDFDKQINRDNYIYFLKDVNDLDTVSVEG